MQNLIENRLEQPGYGEMGLVKTKVLIDRECFNLYLIITTYTSMLIPPV